MITQKMLVKDQEASQAREVTLGHITWFIFKDGPKGCSEHDDLVLDLSFLFAWHKKEGPEKCLNRTHEYVP